MMFANRQEAGQKLASELYQYQKESPVVLALPRGGVPIGYEIAEALQAPLDVIVVRKIGLSSNPEFGIGAIAEGGVRILDQTIIETLGIDANKIADTIISEEQELKRRVEIYRGRRQLPSLSGKAVILVDDGIATGITAKAAIEAVRKLNPRKIILASPVCALDIVESLKNTVDNMICLSMPFELTAVGSWYKNFKQISDEEVVKLLNKSSYFPPGR